MEIIRSGRTRSRKQKEAMQTLTTLALCLIASWKTLKCFPRIVLFYMNASYIDQTLFNKSKICHGTKEER